MKNTSDDLSTADWSWKQALADRILVIVNERFKTTFSIGDVYGFIPEFELLFPRNRHIKEKLRQSLQKLRDDAFLFFDGGGVYRLNMQFQDLQSEAVESPEVGIALPEVKSVLRNIRLRNTLLAIEVKRKYSSVCQVCRQPVWLSVGQCYAEAHHIRPLGAPHFGPDVSGNIIVLCPNHHVMFDRGAVKIVPRTYAVRHLVEGVIAEKCTLYIQEWHILDARQIAYHNRHIFGVE